MAMDIDQAWEFWQQKFLIITEQCIPKGSLPRRKCASWISKQIVSAIRKCNTYYCRAKQTGSYELLNKYKHLKNEVVLARAAERRWREYRPCAGRGRPVDCSPTSRGRREPGQVAKRLNSRRGARVQRGIYTPAAPRAPSGGPCEHIDYGAPCTAIALARLGGHSSRRFDAARGPVPLFAAAPRPRGGRLHRAGRRARWPAVVLFAWEGRRQALARPPCACTNGLHRPAFPHCAPGKFRLPRPAAGLPGANAQLPLPCATVDLAGANACPVGSTAPSRPAGAIAAQGTRHASRLECQRALGAAHGQPQCRRPAGAPATRPGRVLFAHGV